MKVLSITEPFATLIKNKKKFIETRSWKTNYKGELYIHASQTKINKKDADNQELLNLIDDKSLNFGYIICRCRLVDCIYMTKEYVKDLKENNRQEYICGEYSEGRYAWILEDITPLTEPIKAKGQLNIWDYYNEFEIMDLMNNIEYGYVDKEGRKYTKEFDNFADLYILQTPKEIEKSKVGVCWDQVELERYYFKGNDWNIKTYFIVHNDNDKCPTHTFLTFEKNNKYYWFEHSWEICRGIHEYKSEKELLLDVKQKFIKYELNNNYVKNNLYIYRYDKPKYHITTQEFYNHATQDIILLK